MARLMVCLPGAENPMEFPANATVIFECASRRRIGIRFDIPNEGLTAVSLDGPLVGSHPKDSPNSLRIDFRRSKS